MLASRRSSASASASVSGAGQPELAVGGDPGGQRRLGQLVQAGVADSLEHPAWLASAGPDVTLVESVRGEFHGSLPRRAASPASMW